MRPTRRHLDHLRAITAEMAPMPDESWAQCVEHVEHRTYAKDEYLLHAGDVSDHRSRPFDVFRRNEYLRFPF